MDNLLVRNTGDSLDLRLASEVGGRGGGFLELSPQPVGLMLSPSG